MAKIDPNALRPSHLLRLLNGTPSGTVATDRTLRAWLDAAGTRVAGTQPGRVSLVRVVARLAAGRLRGSFPPQGGCFDGLRQQSACVRESGGQEEKNAQPPEDGRVTPKSTGAAKARAGRDRSADVSRKRKQREEAREVDIPPPEDLARRLELEKDRTKWARWYLHLVFYKEFSADQAGWADDLDRIQRDGGKQAIGAPRGQGKTTFIAGVGAVYGLLTGMIRSLVIVAANREKALELLDMIKQMLALPRIAADYPEVGAFIDALTGSPSRAQGLLHNGKPSGFSWQATKIRFPWLPDLAWVKCSGASLVSVGIKGKIRGSNKMTKGGAVLRPDFVLIDDPQDEQTAKSKKIVTNIMKYIDGTVGGLVAQGGKMGQVALVTVIRTGDVASQLLDRAVRPDWSGTKNKLIYELPKNKEALADYEDLVLRCVAQKKCDADGICEETTAYWRAHQAELEEGAVVCSDQLHLPPPAADGTPGTPKAASAIHWAVSKRAVMTQAAFEAEYQNSPTDPMATAPLNIAPTTIQLRANGLPRGTCPPGYDWLTVGVDVMNDYLRMVAVAWHPKTARGHVVDYLAVPVNAAPDAGDVRDRESPAYRRVAEAIPLALERIDTRPDTFEDERAGTPYRRFDGSAVSPHATFVDIRHMGPAVHAFCATRLNRRWAGLAGQTGKQIPRSITANTWVSHDSGYWIKTVVVALPDGGSDVRHYLYHNADDNKRLVQEGWLIPEEMAGALTLFGKQGRDHQAFAEEICAEVWVQKEPGVFVWRTKNDADPNHYLDGMALATAAYRVLRDEGMGWLAPAGSFGSGGSPGAPAADADPSAAPAASVMSDSASDGAAPSESAPVPAYEPHEEEPEEPTPPPSDEDDDDPFAHVRFFDL